MRVLILHLWWQILHVQSITSSWMSRIMTPPLSRASGCRNRTVVSRLYFNALLVSLTGSQIMPGSSPASLPPDQPLAFFWQFPHAPLFFVSRFSAIT
jgi:hypothetical protein